VGTQPGLAIADVLLRPRPADAVEGGVLRCCAPRRSTQLGHFLRDFGFVCASAEAAMDFVRGDVRPSRSAAEAFFATAGDVCLRFVFAIWNLTSHLAPVTGWRCRGRCAASGFSV